MRRRRQCCGDRAGLAGEDPLVGARKTIFRQYRDGLEQGAADRIVEVCGRKPLLARCCQTLDYIAGEAGYSVGRFNHSRQDGTWNKRTGSLAGTSCGTMAATIPAAFAEI